MKRSVLVAILAPSLAACVTAQQATRLAGAPGPRVRAAVVGFDVHARTYGVTDIDKRLVDMLSTALFGTGQYDLVERKDIERVLREQRFQLSDLVDPATAVRIGRILGAQAIVSGAVTEIGFSAGSFLVTMTVCTVGIDIRVIDVETAKVTLAVAGWGRSYRPGIIFNEDAMDAIKRQTMESWINEALRGAAADVARKIARGVAPVR